MAGQPRLLLRLCKGGGGALVFQTLDSLGLGGDDDFRANPSFSPSLMAHMSVSRVSLDGRGVSEGQ